VHNVINEHASQVGHFTLQSVDDALADPEEEGVAIRLRPKQRKIQYTFTITVNAGVQHIISFFKVEVYSVFKSQNIFNLINQQLRKAQGEY